MRRYALALAVLGSACGPRPPAKTAATPPGQLLRLTAHAGDVTHGLGILAMDEEMSAGQEGQIDNPHGGQHVALAFKLATYEKVDSVDPDGTAHVHARLANVSGAASQGGDPERVAQFAAALGQLDVSFARTARGEVDSLDLGELKPPLTDQRVRPLLVPLFAADRGAILPEGPVAPGATWTLTRPFPPAAFAGGFTFRYQYVREGVIACDQVIEGEGGTKTAPRRITGRSADEFQLDRAGRFVTLRIDTTFEVEQTLASGTHTRVKQHVRAEWTRDQEERK